MIKKLFSKQPQRPIWNWLNLCLTLINLSVVLLIVFELFPSRFDIFAYKDQFSVTATIGDTLGPVIGLIGAILVLITYRNQKKTNEFNTSTVFANLMMEELNRIKEEITLIEFKGSKGRLSTASFLHEMYQSGHNFENAPKAVKKIKLAWEIDFDEYIYSLLFVLNKIHREYLKINDLNIDSRLKITLLLKIEELLSRYLENYHEVLDEISKDLQEAIYFESTDIYDNLKIHDINELAKYQTKFKKYLDDFVKAGFVVIIDRYHPITNEVLNPKINEEEIKRLELGKVYRLSNIMKN
jgi:hypothetical protein